MVSFLGGILFEGGGILFDRNSILLDGVFVLGVVIGGVVGGLPLMVEGFEKFFSLMDILIFAWFLVHEC